jgi:hypothetical protein
MIKRRGVEYSKILRLAEVLTTIDSSSDSKIKDDWQPAFIKMIKDKNRRDDLNK